jgi:hypothetical protein
MLIELEGHVLFVIKDEIGDEFHYIWSANILKIIGRHTLMLIIETDLVI